MFNIAGLVSGYGQSKVIHGVDLAVAAGEIVAVMGRNGMGKTTLFKTMMGLLPAMQGSISLEGKALERLESHQRVRSGVAYVPQGRDIFARLTVEENILMGMATKPAARARRINLRKRCGVRRQIDGLRGAGGCAHVLMSERS